MFSSLSVWWAADFSVKSLTGVQRKGNRLPLLVPVDQICFRAAAPPTQIPSKPQRQLRAKKPSRSQIFHFKLAFYDFKLSMWGFVWTFAGSLGSQGQFPQKVNPKGISCEFWAQKCPIMTQN